LVGGVAWGGSEGGSGHAGHGDLGAYGRGEVKVRGP
jgi:hypothetical protein